VLPTRLGIRQLTAARDLNRSWLLLSISPVDRSELSSHVLIVSCTYFPALPLALLPGAQLW